MDAEEPVGGQGQYGASLSGSASSGASQSGAISANGGGFYGGPGPGSVVFGPASGLNISTPIVIGLAVTAVIVIVILFKRR